jgi:hypothetical protein
VAAKTAVATGRLVATKAPAQQHASLATTQTIVQLAIHVRHTTQTALHTVTAMVQFVQSVLLTVTVIHVRLAMTALRAVTMNANRAHSETVKTVQHAVVLVVALATATAQSALHTANQIQLVLKTATQSAVLSLKTETQTVQTAQHAMTHASQPSVVHAIQTQTRRLSSKIRFLSV